MEVLNPSKKHTQALEMVSEEEEDEAALESEHEEGEISSEEEEDEDEVLVDGGEGVACPPVFHSSNYDNSLPSYPSHLSFQDRRTNKKPPSAAVASEVVIYDDSGRTAIFTSPKKPRLNSYPRRGEGLRQHTREGLRRKGKEVERGRRHHSSSAAAPEKWPKTTRRGVTDSKGSGVSEEIHIHPHKGKEVRSSQRARHSRQSSPDSTSGSSSSSSCSCSSSSSSSISCSLSEEESDVASVSPCKGRGKENRRCGPSSKGHDRSPPLREYGCERPPSKVPSKPPGHRSSKHSSSQHRLPSPHPREARRRPSYHHNIRRSSKEREVGKTSHHHQHRTHQKPSKAKPSERKEATKVEKPAKEVESVSNTAKSQNWLPRGSLGEMLLSRPKASSTHPIPPTQSIPRVAGEDPKASVKTKKEEKLEEEVASKLPPSSEPRELSALDQEDDEELQLRLIAIQSSLRLLTDMQKEGQQQEGIGEGALVSTFPTNKAGGDASGFQVIPEEVSLPVACVMRAQKDMADPGSYTPPLRTSQEMAEMEHTLSGDVITIQSTDDIISISSSSASEICVENLATNKSYLEATVEERGAGSEEGGGSKVTDEIKRKLKERPDVDQNPVDMEICDSSGEDEDGTNKVVVLQDSPLSPDPGQDTCQGSGDPASKGEAVARMGDSLNGGSNFQIPVEWAYMVPPPPPPDQPANDIQNISSWCFDQNMYLQSMQAAPTEEQQQQQQQQQQHSQPDTGNAEWPPPQLHNAPWPAPLMESYDNTLASGIPDNTAISVPMGFCLEQHDYPTAASPQPQKTPPEQSKNLKDVPAEQYQAFMSAVLQHQSPTPKGGMTFTECPQRNLILVPLSGNQHSESAAAAGTASKTNKKTKAQKLRAKKRRLKKQRAQENLQQIPSSNSGIMAATAGGASMEEEEEDEDLLRAQLLIDMSRKKEQRVHESQSLPSTSTAATSAILPVPLLTPLPAHVNRAAVVGREDQEDCVSPLTLLQSSESHPPASRNLRMKKSFTARPRSGENSPTHTFRTDMRPGLSDIGGWGLDPKGSKFNYHSTQYDFPHSNSDVPKVKFPPIKPVIISLKSDTEDSEEEDNNSRGASSVDSGRKEAEVEGLASEPMSQSIDILLKSMRNANTTTKEPEPAAAGPSTPSIPPTKSREVADTTPQAVRHLSRYQQEEYRWLKEQLRKKEMLQRKKMQQRPLRIKPPQPLLPPLPSQSPQSPNNAHCTGQDNASPSFTEDSTCSMSPTKEASVETGSEGTSSSTRAVTWKDMGLLQIQVSNEAALDTSNGTDDRRQALETQATGGDSSLDASATEDEDEETLRRMALLTQRKKTENSTLENQHRRVIIEKSRAEEEVSYPEASESEDALADGRNEDHPEGMKGEWMVLDEVREDGIDIGEEELCARAELSENETEECGEEVETSDSTESVNRSFERATLEKDQESKEQDTIKASEELVCKNGESKSSKCEAIMNNTVIEPYKAASLEPTSEDGNSSTPDKKMKDEPSLKADMEHTTEVSRDGERIEEVIRRIENKTRVVQDKAGKECSPMELKRSTFASQGNSRQCLSNSNPAQITKKQQGAELSSKDGNKIDQGVSEVKQAGMPHPSSNEEANTHSLVKFNTTSTTNAFLDTQNKGATKNTAGKWNEGKVTSQRVVISPDISPTMMRKIKVVKPTVNDLQEETGKEASAAVAASITTVTVTAPKEMEKSAKVQLQLKRLEKEYREKKNGENKVIMQLGVLLHEVSEEQKQWQTLKNSVVELRIKLKEMEAQLESKSNAVQTKMEVIHQFQQQLGTERQALNLLEHQGERLGKLIHGSGYSLPKALPSSPNSKTKDVYMKKALASSIHALRQQMRDLTNKRKSNIGSGITNSASSGLQTRVVRKINLETKKESTTGNKKSLPQTLPVNSILVSTSQVASRTISQGKVVSGTSRKPEGKEDAMLVAGKSTLVKRKMVSSGLDIAKVAKVEVPVENLAIQERRVTGVPSGPSKPKADDKEEEEKLDEMKALCPHDLLGRCNDTACQYQHLPSARPSLQATTEGNVQGVKSPVATTTIQGWVGKKKGANGGETGAKVKMVPDDGSRGGCNVIGRIVPEGLTPDMAKKLPPEPDIQTTVQRQVTEAVMLVPDKQTSSTAPVAGTHVTQEQTETLALSQQNAPTAHQQTDTHAITEPNIHIAHQESSITTVTETETPTVHHETVTPIIMELETPSTHQQTETSDTIELLTSTPLEHTITPNTIDEEQTEMSESQTVSDSKTHSEVSTTEITETKMIAIETKTEMNLNEIQTRVPTIEPEQMEMQETQTEASAAEATLQDEAPTGGASSEPQTQTIITELQDEAVLNKQQAENSTQPDSQTSTREPQTGTDNIETQTLLKGTELNLIEVRENKLSGSIHTKMENEVSPITPEAGLLPSSSPGRQLLRRGSQKTGSRPTRCRTLSRDATENHLNSGSGQEGQDVEESATVNREEARVTRKSLRVQAKTSPKSNSCPDSSTRLSPRKNRKRKSGGEETTAKSPSSKRRYPMRP